MLREFVAAVLGGLQVPPAHAAAVAEALVDAECRGVVSHGLLHLSLYVGMLRSGEARAEGHPRVVTDTGALLLVDGEGALGPVTASFGMELAIARAAEAGVGLVLTRNTHTFGAAAFYAEMAVRRRMVGVVCSNSGAVLTPHGAAAPLLGTNPLAIGVPAGAEPPVILDMACSTTAWGTIVLARNEGQATIPPGWALTRQGRPASSPQEALDGALLPFGEAKGSALAIALELLTGALSGAPFDEPVPGWPGLTRYRRRSQWLMAVDIRRLLPLGDFETTVDAFVRQVRGAPRAPGSGEVRLPGERAARARRRAEAEGVALLPSVERDLLGLARDLGVAPPSAVPPPADSARGGMRGTPSRH